MKSLLTTKWNAANKHWPSHWHQWWTLQHLCVDLIERACLSGGSGVAGPGIVHQKNCRGPLSRALPPTEQKFQSIWSTKVLWKPCAYNTIYYLKFNLSTQLNIPIFSPFSPFDLRFSKYFPRSLRFSLPFNVYIFFSQFAQSSWQDYLIRSNFWCDRLNWGILRP